MKRFLLQKAHPCVNPRRLSHFASKLVGGSDPQSPGPKKTPFCVLKEELFTQEDELS